MLWTKIFKIIIKAGFVLGVILGIVGMAAGQDDIWARIEDVSAQGFSDFIHKEVIDNPAESKPAVYYVPGPVLNWEKVSQLFNERRFGELDALFNTTVNVSRISKQGIPNIWSTEEFNFEASDLALCDQYCRQLPDSPWPFIMRAEFYLWYAWEARGNDYAKTVTKSGWRMMNERLQKSLADYMTAIKIKPDLEYAYSGAGKVAMHLGKKRTALNMYRQALALDPASWDAINYIFENSKSKWYGQDDDLMFYLARKISTKHPEYPYLSRLIIKAYEEMAWRYANGDAAKAKAYLSKPEVWNEIIGIYKKLLEAYPESKYLKKHLSETAGWAGKQNEVGDLLW